MCWNRHESDLALVWNITASTFRLKPRTVTSGSGPNTWRRLGFHCHIYFTYENTSILICFQSARATCSNAVMWLKVQADVFGFYSYCSPHPPKPPVVPLWSLYSSIIITALPEWWGKSTIGCCLIWRRFLAYPKDHLCPVWSYRNTWTPTLLEDKAISCPVCRFNDQIISHFSSSSQRDANRSGTSDWLLLKPVELLACPCLRDFSSWMMTVLDWSTVIP